MGQIRALRRNAKYSELKDSENTRYQNLWDMVKQCLEQSLKLQILITEKKKGLKAMT
jgi:hypothetical protein